MIYTYKQLVEIMDESFNYHLDFKSWNEDQFMAFVKAFINGKTEYYQDDYFLKYFAKNVQSTLDNADKA